MAHLLEIQMMHFRYRRLILFLVVLFLPIAAIYLLQRVNEFHQAKEDEAINKERRDSAKAESEKAKDRINADIGRDVYGWLDRIMSLEILNSPKGAAPESGKYSDSAVIAVGALEGDRVVWPWDKAWTPMDNENGFEKALLNAERSERNRELAANLYREALSLAETDRQRAAATLGLARMLAAASLQAETTAAFRDLLKFPATVVDEYGSPYASYAWQRLAALDVSGSEVLASIEGELKMPAMLGPKHISGARAALETLQTSRDPLLRSGAARALGSLIDRQRDLEEAQALVNAHPLSIAPGFWQAFDDFGGSEAIWVGRSSNAGSSRPLIVLVRVEAVRKSVEAARKNAGQPFLLKIGIKGAPLNDHLPGVSAHFDMPEPAAPASHTVRSSTGKFWLIFVVSLTLIGGVLLWQDTRRESHIAELRTQFVSSVSHELKTPLTSIRMFAELLQMGGSVDQKQHDEYLETIVNESERLTRLLNNVLDFSRIERGQKTYHFEPAALPDVVHAAVRTIQFPLTEQGFHLKVDICDEVPPLAIDRDAIQQAVLNLLTNAMKYSGKQRDIELRLRSDRDSILIEVSDHGIGIPEKEQPRIFQKFYRAQVPENRAISGTGLGLALAAHIAQAHQGSVHVKSAPGEGSTFSIRLPLAEGVAA